MSIFKPTYLYIKQHSITGKLYFGKTIREDVEKYLGSGNHWRRHYNYHGKEYVETIWFCVFYDKEECNKFALSFSEQENIVESKQWLNQIVETGLDRYQEGVLGYKHSEETKAKMSIIQKSIPRQKASEETKSKMSVSRTGHSTSQETKAKMSIAQTGKARPVPPWNKGIKVGSPTKSTDKRLKDNIEIGKRKSTKGTTLSKHERKECPHCKGVFGIGILKRYHLDNNCKAINRTYNN